MFGIVSLGLGILSPLTFAACNPEQLVNYKIQLEKDLESYQNLIEMPTLNEKAKIYKDRFTDLEKVQISANLQPIKNKLIEFVNSKTSNFKENYSASFSNTKISPSQITTSATVTNMTEYSVDTIGMNTRTFNVIFTTKTQKLDIKEINSLSLSSTEDKTPSVKEIIGTEEYEKLLSEKLKNHI